MKVLFIHHVTEMHGSTISLFTLIEGLLMEGVHVSLVVPEIWKEDVIFEQKVVELGITVYRVPIVQFIDRTGWSNDLSNLRCLFGNWRLLLRKRKESYERICEVIEMETPDVIHTNVGVIHDGYYAAKKYGIPHVFHLREYQNKDFGWNILPTKHIFERLLKKSAAVITITDDIRTHFNLCNHRRALTVYNGIYSQKDTIYHELKDKYFLYATRLSPEKGCEDVICAFSMFAESNPSYRLVIAGTGPDEYLTELKKLANKSGYADRIEFLGYADNVKELMQNAKALVVASKNEGFGRMTAEAVMLGCMVIGRYTAGTKEIMDKTDGLPFMNTDELVLRMKEVIEMSPNDYKVRALKAQGLANELFSIESNITKTLNVYRSLN